ncbi:MAG: hypothetical protein D6767_08275, partial [Candidatus Hydrogenedentota bacterium]
MDSAKIIEKDLTRSLPNSIFKDLQYMMRKFQEAGYQLYLVGGCVRDLDFATDALPKEVMRIFGHKAHPIGIAFGTVLVVLRSGAYEITTFRHDVEYTDGRRPSKIRFSKSLKEDVVRRDFTINGMAYDPYQKKIIDYVGGYEDLKNRILRTIGNPYDRFKEDGLRSVRACRFTATLELNMDSEIYPAIQSTLDVTASIARERFHDEWRKVVPTKYNFEFLQYLYQTKLTSIFFPDWEKNFGNTQVLNNMQLHFAKFRMRGLHHVFCVMHLYLEPLPFKDEKAWRKKIRKLLSDLKFSNAEKKFCEHALFSPFWKLIEKEEFHRVQVKEVLFLHYPHPVFFPLRILKEYAEVTERDTIKKLVQECVSVIRSHDPYLILHLNITGNDLKKIGFQGREIGIVLKKLLRHVWEKPED